MVRTMTGDFLSGLCTVLSLFLPCVAGSALAEIAMAVTFYCTVLLAVGWNKFTINLVKRDVICNVINYIPSA